MKRKLNNYYLTIQQGESIYDFSQDAFNLYYFSPTKEFAINEIKAEEHLEYKIDDITIYITQEPNSNSDSNKKNEVVRLLRNLPKYTHIVTKKQADKIIYDIKKQK